MRYSAPANANCTPANPITFTTERDLDGALAPVANRTFNGTAFAEHLEITSPGTRVLARFAGGDAAMTLSRYGDGRAILIGTFPSAAFEQEPEKMRATGELLQRLIAFAGVAPEVRIDGAPGSSSRACSNRPARS